MNAEDDLALHAKRVSDDMLALVEKMRELGWQPDGYDHATLTETAKAIGGMSMRAAMASNDPAVMDRVMNGWREMTLGELFPRPEIQRPPERLVVAAHPYPGANIEAVSGEVVLVRTVDTATMSCEVRMQDGSTSRAHYRILTGEASADA